MPATPYDSAIWRSVFHDTALATLFTDTAVLRAELLVMGTIALTQAKAGIVPEVSAKAIQRAAMEVQIDPAALVHKGDPVSGLVTRFKAEMKAPEHATWVHHECDPVDTAATGLALRLKQVTKQFSARLDGTPQADTLGKLTPQVLCAFHRNAALLPDIAAGLGLVAATNTSALPGLRSLADWIVTTGQTLPADTPARQVAHSTLAPLQQVLADATPQTATIATAYVAPQMCMALAILLPK